MNEVKELNQKEVTVKGSKYILRSEFSESGPHFSIWDISYNVNNINKMYAEVFLIRKDLNLFEFNIIVHYDLCKRCGLGTFLMNKIAMWCHENGVKYFYGFLSDRDKDRGNWNESLPFYKKLPQKVRLIRKTYFFTSKKHISDVKKYKKNAISIKNMYSFDSGVVLFVIK